MKISLPFGGRRESGETPVLGAESGFPRDYSFLREWAPVSSGTVLFPFWPLFPPPSRLLTFLELKGQSNIFAISLQSCSPYQLCNGDYQSQRREDLQPVVWKANSRRMRSISPFLCSFSVFLVPVEEEEEGIGQGRVYLPSDSFCSMKLYHLAYRTRIELIQGYEFNSACSKIKLSKDGQYIIASGMLVSCLLRIE